MLPMFWQQVISTSIVRQGVPYAGAYRPEQQSSRPNGKYSKQRRSSISNATYQTIPDTDLPVTNASQLQHSNQTVIDSSLAQIIILMQQTIAGLQKTISEL